MQNEILKPVLDTDEVAVPRYDIVGPNGSVIQQNVELRLKNEVVQEGTPYDEESVLPALLREQLELPQSATPAEAFLRMLKVSGGAVARNRAPQTSDAQPAGKIWIVPKMVFNNQMPNALTQVASNWKCTAATAAVSGNKVTVTGNGGAATLVAEATMLTAVKAVDLLYVTADVTVLDDANSVTIELICDNNVVATQSLNVPTGGDTMQLVSRAPAGANAIPKLRVTSVYNTASAQSGKRVSVAAITVWNLTADMCQIEPELEFTQAEATAYLTQYGAFQSRVYELSTYWWLCQGVQNSQYSWIQGLDDSRQASMSEAVSGEDDFKWVSPKHVLEFYKAKGATAADLSQGSPNAWVSAEQYRDLKNLLYLGAYQAYIDANSEESVAAALGKNNEDITWVGLALYKYEQFKNPESSVSEVLATVPTVPALFASVDAIIALDTAPNVDALLRANPYSATYYSIPEESIYCSLMASLAGVPNWPEIQTYAQLVSCFAGRAEAFNAGFSKYDVATAAHKTQMQQAFFAQNSASSIFSNAALIDLCLDMPMLGTYMDDKQEYITAANACSYKSNYSHDSVKGNLTVTNAPCFCLSASRSGGASGQNCTASIGTGMTTGTIASSSNQNSVSYSGLKAMKNLILYEYNPMSGGASAAAVYIPHS